MAYDIYDKAADRIITATHYREGALHVLYETWYGRLLLKAYFSRPVYSMLTGFWMNRRASAKRIPAFVDRYKIRLEDFEAREYLSFNDFFTRKATAKARPISPDPLDLIAVADAKLGVYVIDNRLSIHVKHSIYSVSELLDDKSTAKAFSGGMCLVYRLTVDDGHRYLFPDDGTLLSSRKIRGRLHTVSPISEKRHRVYSENQRELSLLSTQRLGEIVQIEVGAIQIGKIINHELKTFRRGDEKGYFAFGGSTVILLIPAGRVCIDADISAYALQGIETQVRMGERIGRILV
ncbi:MAG TPA: phosphatidylserine decarboxylase [Sedimentisphaerales bacterium]